MKKSTRIWMIFLAFVFVISACGFYGIPTIAASKTADICTAKKKQYGFFKKEGCTYFRKKNGKLYRKEELIKGNYVYCFDKTGRLIDKKKVYTLTLKVNLKKGDEILAKNKRHCVRINKNMKVYGKKGNRISALKLKEGQKIKIFFDGRIMESYPEQFSKVYKIQILK